MSATEAPPAGKPPVGQSAKLPETGEPAPAVGAQDARKEPNPFADGDWRMLVHAWSGLAVRIVIIVGAIFSVYQFLAAREETRIQRALEMVQLWEQPDYQNAQRAVRKRIDALNAEYAKLLHDQPDSSARAIVQKKIGLMAMTPEGGALPAEEFREQFDRVVYFLNRVSFCVEGGLCSRDVIDVYFRDYATSFWDYFSDYANQQRDAISPTYAQPIEAYVLGDARPGAVP